MLFREEVLKRQGSRLYGTISLAQPVSIYTAIATILAFTFIVLVFLSCSEYARKETVRGFLVPDAGIIKIYPFRSGYVDEIFVKEGDVVKEGDLLAKVLLSRPQLNGTELSESLIVSLELQLSILNKDYQSASIMAELNLNRLWQKLSSLSENEKALLRQRALLESKKELQVKEFSRFEKLYQEDYLSDLEFQKQQQMLIQIDQELEENIERQINTLSQINEVTSEIDNHPHQTALNLAEISRRKADIQRQIDETRNGYEFTVIAKESGLISSVSLKEGEFIQSGRPLLTIIPRDAELVAELLLPTRSAGFVKLKDEARLRFDAFPYQRFGFVTSEVSRIDKSLMISGEADIPIQLSEPIYKVQTRLSTQSISAYGEEFHLKPGMLFEADIILDKRSLLDWILDPIYSLKGRVG